MPSIVPFRVVLSTKRKSRKFFTLFQGRDGSLYIHPYRPKGQPWRIAGSTDDKNSSVMHLDFVNFKEPAFELHKISFHPSGYIHLTNKNGQRYKEGTQGPAFNNMSLPYLFCILCPCKLDFLPVFEGDNKSMVVELILPDDVGPFYLTLTLSKGDIVAEESQGSLLTPTIVLPLNSGYKLIFVLRSVQSRNGDEPVIWPPFPFFLCRIGA